MKVAVVCKLMPYYRLGVFHELSKYNNPEYVFLGDTKEQDGIYTIPWEFSKLPVKEGGIRWEFTKSVFYKPNRQLWQTGILKRIFSKEYDLFIFEGAVAHFSIWIFALACKLMGRKTLFWTHGFKGTDKGVLKHVRAFFFKYMANGLLLYGDFSRDFMINEGFKPKKLFTIGNSLNYKEQKQIREKLSEKKEDLTKFKEELFKNPTNKTIVFIGRLAKNKKVASILQMMYELKNEGIDLNCIIIGDGVERRNLEALILRYELIDLVHITGRVYEDEIIAKYFLISDVMVSPGNVGLNCIHSLSFGLPVITHDNFSFQNPEVEAIEHGKNGLLYKYNDMDNLKMNIREWFSKERIDTKMYCIQSIENKFNPFRHAELINKAALAVIDTH